MSKTKKLLSLLLALMVLVSSMGTAMTVWAEDTESAATVITEDPAQFLYEQAVAGATADGATSPTVGNNRIGITQAGAWRVAGMRPAGSTFADVTGYWLRANSSSSINAEYGYSTWSYTTPSIAVKYKPSSTTDKMLQTWLRPNSTADGDRKNAFMSLYYIAETSGDYSLIDSMGGFSVSESGASGYEVYVTILANGEEIYKSVPLTRVNRIAKFGGASFYLAKGEKLEINFTYNLTAETYSGEFYIDFDPHISLVDEYEIAKPELQGDGDVAAILYDALEQLDAAGTNKSAAVTQTAIWRAQLYRSSKWSDLTYYSNHSKSYTGSGLDWGYDDGSYSQTDRMNIKYINSTVSNGLFICACIPMTRWNMKPLRLAYTAEYDGTYSLTDKLGGFTVSTGALTVYDYWVQITHNDSVIWKSDVLANAGDKAEFNGVTVDMSAGDSLAIEFQYKKKTGATEEYDTTRCNVDFAPVLSYLPKAKTETYSAKQAFIDTMSTVRADDANANAAGTLTQPTTGWIFEHGKKYESLTPLTHYGYTVGVWGSSRLQPAESQSGGEPAVVYDTGSSHDYYKKLYLQLRSCMELNGSGIRDGYYAYDYAYTFKAPRTGAYILSESDLTLFENSTISGILAKVYKNDTLMYTTETVNNSNKTAVIPEMKYLLNAGDEICIFFERQHKAEDKNFNHYMYVGCEPTITYYEDVSVLEEDKVGYNPVYTTRYYAEALTVPTSVSAYVNTTAVIAGAVVSSDALSLELLGGGNPVLTYKNGEEYKQIVFPVDARGEQKKLEVSYDTDSEKWNCYINDVLVSSVEDTDFVSGDTIDKLYIGASADEYNNGSFNGSIAELTFGDESWTLEDITAEEGLNAETVDVKTDCSETGITFKDYNSRIDMYEVFENPVSTFEAWVQLDSNYMDNKSAGRLLGNSYNFKPYSQLNIAAGGKPQLVVCDANNNTASVTFDVDIRSDEYVHLAITADAENGIYKCYVDGVLVDTVESSMVIPVGLRPYLIAGDYYHNNYPVNFEGSLAGLALFDDVRTADEILGDMYGETDLADSALQGKWSLADKEQGLINQNGSGINLHPFWEDEPDCTVDDSYGNYSTFVFIPDTQNFTQSQGTSGLNNIVNWILENKDSENIIGVMGLGDITNNNSTSQWNAAADAFNNLMGQVPYVFVAGNHDMANTTTDGEGNVIRNTNGLNTAFPFDTWEPYIDGYFEEGKIDNMYVLTEDAAGQKYMMLGLEFQPRDTVLEWANRVVAEHPDHKVIVSTHGYQQYSHESKNQYHISGDEYASVCGDDSNTGSEIWDKFVRKHANIQAVFCGHVYQEDIHVTTSIGDNGNTVVEVISNAQTTDVLMRMSGTITIVRVSEDGTKANVNQYAAHHDHYNKDLNQFEMDWIRETPVASVDGELYMTLADAIAEAADGQTVTLMRDVEIDAVIDCEKNITIDLNGKTITNKTDADTPFNSVTVKLQNGKLAGFVVVEGLLTEDYGMVYFDGVYTVDFSANIADINTSGVIDAADLGYIRQKLLGSIVDDYVYDINGKDGFNIIDLIKAKKLAAS